MSVASSSERVHPLHRFAGRLHEVLDDLGSPASWSMTTGELAETISELAAGVARLQGLGLGLVADADRSDLAASTGHVNTAELVRSSTRVTGREARATVRFSRALEQHSRTRDALGRGVVCLDQARQIVAAVEALPASVPESEVARAEAHLLGEARKHDAHGLKVLGRHLEAVIDPEHADAVEGERLRREEAKAERTTYLETRDCGDGTTEGRYRIPHLHQAILDRILGAYLNPNRPDPIDRRAQLRSQARGQALCQFLERVEVDRHPRTGGMSARVMVVITLETLLGGLKKAHLDTGQPISPTLARRLACQAGIIPVVMDGDGAVLDLGPEVRFHTEKQRLAMMLQQDGTCGVEDCDRPAWLCDGAHLVAHHTGGSTSVKDGALLCPRHHTLADSGKFQVRRLGPGRIRLVRRQ